MFSGGFLTHWQFPCWTMVHLCGHDSAPKETQRRCKTKHMDTFWELAKTIPSGSSLRGHVLDAHQVQTPTEHDSEFICFRWMMREWSRKNTMSARVSDNHNQKNWAWEVESILAKCGLRSWWHQSSCDGLSHGEAKHVVTCCLFHLERENWNSDIVSKPKLS